MARSAKVEGLERLRQRVLSRLPAAAKAEIRKANERTAADFMKTVQRIIPKGDPERGHIVDTLRSEPVAASTGVAVTIGDAAHPYPLHLEAGHKAPDGSHVPGKPAWNPAKRLARKRHKGRAARALRAAIKITAGNE